MVTSAAVMAASSRAAQRGVKPRAQRTQIGIRCDARKVQGREGAMHGRGGTREGLNKVWQPTNRRFNRRFWRRGRLGLRVWGRRSHGGEGSIIIHGYIHLFLSQYLTHSGSRGASVAHTNRGWELGGLGNWYLLEVFVDLATQGKGIAERKFASLVKQISAQLNF